MTSKFPHLTAHNLHPSSPFWGSPVGFLHSSCVHVLDESTIQQTIRELQKLDDHAVKDIGLLRSEIESEVRRTQKGRSRSTVQGDRG
jgi:hypothetical protein